MSREWIGSLDDEVDRLRAAAKSAASRDTASKRDVLDALRGLLTHRTADLGCYEFVLESWIKSAADEIERLSLTDVERAAVATAIAECESMPTTKSREAADTLRSLLERLQ